MEVSSRQSFSRLNISYPIFLLLAMAAGLFVAAMPPEATLIALGAGLVLVLFFVVEPDILLITLVIVSTSVSVNYWLDHRFQVGSFPISVPDLVLVAFGLYGFVRCFRARRLD